MAAASRERHSLNAYPAVHRALILVKHAMPIIAPADPPSTWRLGEAGRAGSRTLARSLAAYQPAIVVSSVEPKAAETAAIVAAELSCPVMRMTGLHEHQRDKVGFLGDQEFQSGIARFFAHPSKLVFGDETADAARIRFTAAVELAIEEDRTRNLIVVAHGTVISLYVAAVAGVDALALWGRLGLPSYVTLTLPDYHLLEVVDAVDIPI